MIIEGDTLRLAALRMTRENGKVKSRTLANLSMQPDHAIDALRQSLKGERLIACRNPPLAVRRAAKRQSMLEGHSH